MEQITNALSNKIFYDKNKNIIIKEYIRDEFKVHFTNNEINILEKYGINCKLINKDKIEIEYIEHEKFDNKKDINIKNIFLIINALKKMHRLSTTNIKYIDYESIYEKVFLKDKDKGSITNMEIKIMKKSIEILKSGKQVILHNDMVEGNILKTGDTITLIDFEYVGLGNPIFDIASFITENQLTPEQITLFVDSYDNKINSKDLIIVSAFLEIFWTRWALFKFQKNGKKIYQDISKIKYKNYKKIIENIEL